jgi:hypothetical protein
VRLTNDIIIRNYFAIWISLDRSYRKNLIVPLGDDDIDKMSGLWIFETSLKYDTERSPDVQGEIFTFILS